jgi:hypothetical protein
MTLKLTGNSKNSNIEKNRAASGEGILSGWYYDDCPA